jgi:hypothetical protein
VTGAGVTTVVYLELICRCGVYIVFALAVASSIVLGSNPHGYDDSKLSN